MGMGGGDLLGGINFGGSNNMMGGNMGGGDLLGDMGFGSSPSNNQSQDVLKITALDDGNINIVFNCTKVCI